MCRRERMTLFHVLSLIFELTSTFHGNVPFRTSSGAAKTRLASSAWGYSTPSPDRPGQGRVCYLSSRCGQLYSVDWWSIITEGIAGHDIAN